MSSHRLLRDFRPGSGPSQREEIAARLGCGRRTVERKLGVIRSMWGAAEAD